MLNQNSNKELHNSAGDPLISVIIAVRNNEKVIGQTLKTIFQNDYKHFEVVVCLDNPEDNSEQIVRSYPCQVVNTSDQVGCAKARNLAVGAACGKILFITDADCHFFKDTLSKAVKAYQQQGASGSRRGGKLGIVGGSYSPIPVDAQSFTSFFQSLHVNYYETKRDKPEYVAGHSFIISRSLFLELGGFPADLDYGLKDGCTRDIALCHIAKKKNYPVTVHKDILVQHNFRFNLLKSLRNAFDKSRVWIVFSWTEKDLLHDSGSASTDMKLSGIFTALALFFFSLTIITQGYCCFWFGIISLFGSWFVNFKFYIFIYQETKIAASSAAALWFLIRAILFYSVMLVVILAGSVYGLAGYFLKRSKIAKYN